MLRILSCLFRVCAPSRGESMCGCVMLKKNIEDHLLRPGGRDRGRKSFLPILLVFRQNVTLCSCDLFLDLIDVDVDVFCMRSIFALPLHTDGSNRAERHRRTTDRNGRDTKDDLILQVAGKPVSRLGARACRSYRRRPCEDAVVVYRPPTERPGLADRGRSYNRIRTSSNKNCTATSPNAGLGVY